MAPYALKLTSANGVNPNTPSSMGRPTEALNCGPTNQTVVNDRSKRSIDYSEPHLGKSALRLRGVGLAEDARMAVDVGL